MSKTKSKVEEYITRYSPKVKRRNPKMRAQEVNIKIVEFYTVFAPEKVNDQRNHEKLVKFAQNKGYLALQREIKFKYNHSLEEADSTPQGWFQVQNLLERYYAKHNVEKTALSIKEMMFWTRKKGLAKLDEKLKTTYNESLSEFEGRNVTNWKKTWNATITTFSRENYMYQLRRFYACLGKLTSEVKTDDELKTLVDWAMAHTREDVNEKLLLKYKISLDDVRMTKGLTNQERINNLAGELTAFYQIYDQERLKRPEEIRELARNGLIYYEDMNESLKSRYAANLLDSGKEKLATLLQKFYYRHNATKTPEQLERLTKYGIEYGVDALNKKLTAQYGECLEDLEVDEF